MDLSHVDDVVAIEKLSFKTPWSRDAFISEIVRNKCARYRIIKIGERVIAYGGMWIMVDEAHITNIAVAPKYRGEGIGNVIVEDMINCARGLNINSMTLEARKSNTIALNLYSKFGFKEVGIRKGYYQDTGEDAVIMWKTISPAIDGTYKVLT